jgi:dolichol-phosphate mannosyltransferase
MEHLQRVCKKHRFAKAVGLSRNFGQAVALAAGFAHARGHYVGSINVDMEDPPDQIPLLLDEFEKGDVDVIFGVRKERHSPFMVKLTSLLFHWVLNKLTGYNYPLNVATLRVMNRRFTDAYLCFTEKAPFLDGLQFWLGFRRGYVAITHQLRKEGRSSYNFALRLRVALDSIISFSDLPLRMTVVAGSFIALCGFLYAVSIIIQKLFVREFLAGYPSMVSIIMFLGGVQILVIGLASLYSGRILREVQNRPLYVVREEVGFSETSNEVGRSSYEQPNSLRQRYPRTRLRHRA